MRNYQSVETIEIKLRFRCMCAARTASVLSRASAIQLCVANSDPQQNVALKMMPPPPLQFYISFLFFTTIDHFTSSSLDNKGTTPYT